MITDRDEPKRVGEILKTGVLPHMQTAINRWNARSPQEQQQILEEERARERAFEIERRRPEIDRKLAEIPARFKDASFTKSVVFDWTERFIAHLDGDSAGIMGMAFTGGTGTYKTMNMWAIFKEVVSAGHLSIEYRTSENLLEELRSAKNAHEIITKVSRCSLLLLDDLGTQSVTDWRETKLLQILDNRWADKRTTIIATNLLITSVHKTFGPRIGGRILELCPETLTFTGPDARYPEKK